MITISGTVIGDLARVVFLPSEPRFSNPDGNIVVSEPIYADLDQVPGVCAVSVELPDNEELIDPQDWFWQVYETSKLGHTTQFTVPSDPSSYQYADIRPVEEGP